MTKNWIPTTQAEAIARARGRRRYNSERQDRAIIRPRRDDEAVPGLWRWAGHQGAHRAQTRRSPLDHHARLATGRLGPCFTVPCGTAKDNKVWELQSFRSGSHSHDPYSAVGQAEIMARKVLIELLPVVLADLGFFEGDNGSLVNGNDDDRDIGFTASDLARRVMTAVDPHSAGLDVAA